MERSVFHVPRGRSFISPNSDNPKWLWKDLKVGFSDPELEVWAFCPNLTETRPDAVELCKKRYSTIGLYCEMLLPRTLGVPMPEINLVASLSNKP